MPPPPTIQRPACNAKGARTGVFSEDDGRRSSQPHRPTDPTAATTTAAAATTIAAATTTSSAATTTAAATTFRSLRLLQLLGADASRGSHGKQDDVRNRELDRVSPPLAERWAAAEAPLSNSDDRESPPLAERWAAAEAHLSNAAALMLTPLTETSTPRLARQDKHGSQPRTRADSFPKSPSLTVSKRRCVPRISWRAGRCTQPRTG